MMLSVLCPMEPVEPRIANFFTLFIFAYSEAEARGGRLFLVCREPSEGPWLLSYPSSAAFEGWPAYCGALTTT